MVYLVDPETELQLMSALLPSEFNDMFNVFGPVTFSTLTVMLNVLLLASKPLLLQKIIVACPPSSSEVGVNSIMPVDEFMKKEFSPSDDPEKVSVSLQGLLHITW